MVNSFKDFLKLPFNNVGGKIKTLALVCCWIEILLCIIAGICIMVGGISFGRWIGLGRVIYDVGGFIIGVAVIILGSLLSIISNYGLYAFGTLVENSELLGNISIKLNNIDKTTKDIDKLLRENKQEGSINTDKKAEEKSDSGRISTFPVNSRQGTTEDIIFFSPQNNKQDESGKTEINDDNKKQASVSGSEPSNLIHPIMVSDKSIQCPYCGNIQPKDSKVCSKCGAKFF